MPSTYTTNLGIEKIATGEQSGTWGNTTNTNLDILDQSIDGIISITLASAGSSGSPNSLPITDGAVSNGRNKFIEFVDGGDLGATAYVQLTPNDSEKIVHIRNSLSASRSIIVFQGTYNASNDYEILNGEDVLLKFDGAGAGAVVSQVFANLSLPSVNIDGGTIDGATIGGSTAGAGTFTSLDTSAVSGIIQSNANFIDACLVGPSVDGKAWSGKFENGSVWSSLMLASVETSGSDAEVNIWDLTAGALASASPLATVTLTGATPTSIAASMGYVIVGTSDQGFHIVDPHGGSWAERTVGWPRSLTTTTTPALTNANVTKVCAGFAQEPPLDPRTGGGMPCFGLAYGAGSDVTAIVKHDGNVWDRSGTITDSVTVAIMDGYFAYTVENPDDLIYLSTPAIDAITANDWARVNIFQSSLPVGADQSIDYHNGWILAADSGGLLIATRDGKPQGDAGLVACITNAFNTGFMPTGSTVSTKLATGANSSTADRSGNGFTLTESGTVPSGAVASGAELQAYGPYTASNYRSKSSETTWESIGSNPATIEFWFKSSGSATTELLVGLSIAADTIRFLVYLQNDGTLTGVSNGASANVQVSTTEAFDDGVWHHVVWTRKSGGEYHELIVDGVSMGVNTTASGSLTTTSFPFMIGYNSAAATVPALTSQTALERFALAHISVAQARHSYITEKKMFATNAKCLLQGASDAVLDARIDPLTGKYIVTQSDTQDIFDGLAIESERTIATGGTTFEHGLLWGDGVAEINDANLYASMPATDQRQVNEMVRSMAAELPAGVDLSKAKAWAVADGSTGSVWTTKASMNVEAGSRDSTGQYTVTWAVPFKSADYSVLVFTDLFSVTYNGTQTASTFPFLTRNTAPAAADSGRIFLVAFGELENE